MLFSQWDELHNQHWFFFGLMLKIIFCSLKYLNTEYNYRLGWLCVHSPSSGWQFLMSVLRQVRGMDWMIFLSTTSIYTEITLHCSDTNLGRTDQIQLPCWRSQPMSHSWLTSVLAFLCIPLPSPTLKHIGILWATFLQAPTSVSVQRKCQGGFVWARETAYV